MKKTLCSILAIITCFSMLAGCSADTESSDTDVTSEASVTSEAEKEQTTKSTTTTAEQKAPTEEADISEPTAEADTEPTKETDAEPTEEVRADLTEEVSAPSAETEIPEPTAEAPDVTTSTETPSVSEPVEVQGSFDAAQIPEAYCAEEYGNIILGMPAEGYSMRMVYVFDDDQTLIDTVVHLIPGEITSLEEMFEGADIDAPMESFVFTDGYYTASAGLADMVSTDYATILETTQYTVEFYNMLMGWAEQIEQENADVSSSEYTVTVELGTAEQYESTLNEDGSFSMTPVPVPAIEIEAKIKTDVDFDDLVAPAVSIDVDGEITELESYGKSKMGGVAAWNYSHIIGDDAFETVTVTVDGAVYEYTYAELS